MVHQRMMRLVCIFSVSLMLAALLAVLGATRAGNTSTAYAATNQFHGVNWANPNDNFITGDLVPVGLSASDSYSTTYTKATEILEGFQKLGANTVRMPFNAATVSDSWWNSYTGAMDAATALGMNVVLAPWLQGGNIGNTTSFYNMWNVVINKYVGNSNFYFDIMNEPNGYNATDEDNVAAAWVANYSNVPRGRILVPGAYSDQNLCTVGADSRLNGTLLSIHIYGMFGDSHTTESDWVTDFENNLCGYSSRAVLTEFGVPMNTGVNYDGPRNGNNNLSFLYAITDTVRSLNMGSILWTGVRQATQTNGPGPCENGSCAITSLNGSGTNLSLSITNHSGLERLQYGWGLTNIAGGTGSSSFTPTPGTDYIIVNNNSDQNIDVTAGSTSNGGLIDQWPNTGGTNQEWTFVAVNGGYKIVNVNSGLLLDDPGGNTTEGTQLDQWNDTNGSNQWWNIVSDSDGFYSLANQSSGLYVDVSANSTTNGAAVIEWPSDGGTNQQWSFIAINAGSSSFTPTPGARYIIVNNNSDQNIDVTAGSTSNGGLIDQWPNTGGTNQEWTFVAVNGGYKIVNVNSVLLLDDPGFNTTEGTQLDQWSDTNGSNQWWNIVSDSDGFYSLANQSSGLYVDVSGASTTNGAAVVEWPSDGGTNQQWSFELV